MGQKLLKKIRYSKICLETRKRLIKRVVEDGFSISSSAKFLKIKASTAKAIVKKYRTSGKIHIGKKEQEKKKNQENNLQIQGDQANLNTQIQYCSQNQQFQRIFVMYHEFQQQMLNFYACSNYFYQWSPFDNNNYQI